VHLNIIISNMIESLLVYKHKRSDDEIAFSTQIKYK